MNDPMRVLDLFCSAGGSAMGLHQAWPDAEITGVDVVKQPNYPFHFVNADAMTFPLDGYDFIWASPPCQAHSKSSGRSLGGIRRDHPQLIEPTRARLMEWGGDWVMENVEGAPLNRTFLLCGSMFGLDVQRHRQFESSFLVLAPSCQHSWQTPRFRCFDNRVQSGLSCVVPVYGHLNYAGERELRQRAMQIDWMDDHELTQAIPPAYSRFIAQQFSGSVS